ncbi:MAG: thioredoxin [Planctomycetes bacterium]|nr:thioredoxin [Planctomycetota bacterium]NOG53437.1 thioredoxin [Planctomycetota bacterium]
MASEHVTEFTDDNFQAEVLESDVPVLVDFWAEWCMPCKMLAPTIEKIGEAYSGKVKVGKMDTDSNRNTAFQFNISAIPTVILFQGGQVKDKLVGLKQENDFRAMLDRALTE